LFCGFLLYLYFFQSFLFFTSDLIFTNEEGMIDTIEHNAPLGNSDHETLEFNFRFDHIC
jgi:hypothetical protein